ncbi:hypothetical protein, partial [Staphylococcus haemolyticus]|uniref:hypothetical protein n=3 Tax=Bacilli TaxID=91061 RepID=UPI0034D62F1D
SVSFAERTKQENRALLRVDGIALAIKTPFDILISGYQPLILSKGVFLCLKTTKVYHILDGIVSIT